MINTTPKEKAAAAIAALHLTMEAKFVPWSQSRNKDEKHKSLNWLVTIKRDGRDVLTTDYSAGIAHCPSYGAKAWQQSDAATECETGETFKAPGGIGSRLPILPNIADVLYSLYMDSDVLNYASFEPWATNFGYDVDSRKDEAVYIACLANTLKLKYAIGETGLQSLAKVFRHY